MAETPVKMHGVIVGTNEEGTWIANMTSPTSLPGVELSPDALCLTKSYSSIGARTRITNHNCPDLPVRKGDSVVAHVSTETELTGAMIDNPIYSSGNLRAPYKIPETRVVGASATRWGLKPNLD